MRPFHSLRKLLRKQAAEEQAIRLEVRQHNFRRALYVATLSIPLNIALLTSFLYHLHEGTAIEVQWRHGIVALHTALVCINTSLALCGWYARLTRKHYTVLSSILVNGVFIVLPLWGAIAVILDQLVTSSIIAFFLNCATCALVLLMPPVFSFVYYALAYLVYHFGMALTQTNPSLLLTNRVNGMGAVGICFGISMLLWRNNAIRIRQSRQIREQQEVLEKNYDKLLQSADALEKANATKDKFFSIIAHDLRGPITATLSVSELLLHDNTFAETPEERDEMMRLLHDSLDNASKLLENLLTWSRSQTNTIPYQPAKLNLHGQVQANLGLLHVVASHKHITIYNHTTPGIYVMADAEMLNTVLRNLISNAIKFTHENGHIHISAAPEESAGARPFIHVSIRDNGIGISAKKLGALFQIENKTTSLGTNQETGTGLGLLLCKEFIERQGGHIWAESEEGKGSCFTFTLPVAD